MKPVIQCEYGCRCGIKDRKVSVLAREENEDLLEWMEKLKNSVYIDHSNISPGCQQKTLEYLLIPLPKSDQAKIGGVV